MSHEKIQGSKHAVSTASFQDDASGNRSLHMAANARNLTTLHLKITQTSPGVVQGMGGDTRATLPGGAIPVCLRVYGFLNDAVTGATISIGLDNVTSAHFLSSYNVANAPTGLGQTTPSANNLFAAIPIMPLGQDHTIVGHYAVAGTSAGGGPWFCAIDYYLPDPA